MVKPLFTHNLEAPEPVDMLRAFLEQPGKQGFLVINAEGKIVYVNKRLFQILGFSDDVDLIGKGVYEPFCFYGDTGEKLRDQVLPFYVALTKGVEQLMPFFCYYDLPEGKRIQLVLHSHVVRDEQNAPSGVIIEIRPAERVLKADEMKTTFVSFAAHQLKTPSSIVKGFLELLLQDVKEVLSPEHVGFLLAAYEANEQLITRSQSLLNLTKIQGGMIEPSISRLHIGELLQKRIGSYALWMKTRGLTVDVRAQMDYYFHTDGSLLSEMFDIIFQNALKFSPEGGQIVVSYDISPERLEIHVIDAGPGFANHVAEQLSAAVEEVAPYHVQSHGLGLHLARQYAHILQGKIERVLSGKGTHMVIVLPALH